MSSPRTSVVYDTYWRFAAERQRVYFARLSRSPHPWTDDPILERFRFTNAYRAADRVSQYLIGRVIYATDMDVSADDLAFRILLFKVFNRIDTWELIESQLGPVRFRGFRFDCCDRILSRAMKSGRAIYSPAYIMPPGSQLGYTRKHRNHLALLERMIRDGLAHKLGRARSMREGFELLSSYPTIGPFLGYQFVTDLNYSELTDFTESEFVVPGPGAISGLRKAFPDPAGLSGADLIRYVADRQEEEFDRRGVSFKGLFGRRLQLIDCQNLFCEVDKYSRVAHPDHRAGSTRTKIKQRFRPAGQVPTPWFPPEWGINDAVREALSES